MPYCLDSTRQLCREHLHSSIIYINREREGASLTVFIFIVREREEKKNLPLEYMSFAVGLVINILSHTETINLLLSHNRFMT